MGALPTFPWAVGERDLSNVAAELFAWTIGSTVVPFTEMRNTSLNPLNMEGEDFRIQMHVLQCKNF